MTRKIVSGLVLLAVSVAGVGGFGIHQGWFHRSTKPVAANPTREKEEAEAAARHCRCQPRHWRYLMLQQQQ